MSTDLDQPYQRTQRTASATFRGVSSAGSGGRVSGTLGEGRRGSCKDGGINGKGNEIDSDMAMDKALFSLGYSNKSGYGG